MSAHSQVMVSLTPSLYSCLQISQTIGSARVLCYIALKMKRSRHSLCKVLMSPRQAHMSCHIGSSLYRQIRHFF